MRLPSGRGKVLAGGLSAALTAAIGLVRCGPRGGSQQRGLRGRKGEGRAKPSPDSTTIVAVVISIDETDSIFVAGRCEIKGPRRSPTAHGRAV